MKKPISPTAHAGIDYGYVAMMAAAPSLLGLDGTARTLPYAFAGGQGVLTALTDQPLALRRVVPWRIHRVADAASAPALVALPWLTGALRDPRARAFFLTASALVVAVYALTDWDAAEAGRR